MSRALRLLRFPIFLSVVLLLVAVALPGRTDEAVRVYLLVLAAFGRGDMDAQRLLPHHLGGARELVRRLTLEPYRREERAHLRARRGPVGAGRILDRFRAHQ